MLQPTRNAFEMEVPTIATIVNDPKLSKVIQASLVNVLTYLEIDAVRQETLAHRIVSAAQCSGRDTSYERTIHNLLVTEGIVGAIPKGLAGRSQLIFDQIRTYLKGPAVLDIGCGDGGVSALLEMHGFAPQLMDVYEHNNVTKLGLPFTLINQAGLLDNIAIKNFDSVLLLTVLHHSDSPHNLIKEAARVLAVGGRLIVIESVFGVGAETPIIQPNDQNFLALSSEEQRLWNIFFDHFYNRIVHYSEDAKMKVNVPFNFNTPGKWAKLFMSAGLVQENQIILGIDQPIVPEYHVLGVYQKAV